MGRTIKRFITSHALQYAEQYGGISGYTYNASQTTALAGQSMARKFRIYGGRYIIAKYIDGQSLVSSPAGVMILLLLFN